MIKFVVTFWCVCFVIYFFTGCQSDNTERYPDYESSGYSYRETESTYDYDDTSTSSSSYQSEDTEDTEDKKSYSTKKKTETSHTWGMENYDNAEDYAYDYAEDYAYDEFGDNPSEEAYEYGYEEAYEDWEEEMGE